MLTNDPKVVVVFVVGEHQVASLPQSGDKVVMTVRVLPEPKRVIGGEALAEPEVVPLPLGHGVAKPVMGDFMDDHILPAFRSRSRD